jgi:hypothetical protein
MGGGGAAANDIEKKSLLAANSKSISEKTIAISGWAIDKWE